MKRHTKLRQDGSIQLLDINCREGIADIRVMRDGLEAATIHIDKNGVTITTPDEGETR